MGVDYSVIILADSKNITQMVSSVTISGDLLSSARTCNLSYVSSALDQNIPKLNLPLATKIKITEFNKNIFTGILLEHQKTTDSNTIDNTCYDCGLYIKRNKGMYKIKNMFPQDVVVKICKDHEIAIGYIAKSSVQIKGNYINKSLYEIIMDCYSKASKKTGEKYMIRFDGDKLNVIEKGIKDKAVMLYSGYNLLTSAVTETAKDMVNQVAIYDENDKLITTIKNDNDVKVFGVFREYHKASKSKDYKQDAKDKLKTVERKITVTNFGNIECITGNAVIVKEPHTGLYGYFYIDSDTHVWKNGIYTNKLVLNFKNIMDEKDVIEIEKKQASAKSNNKKDGKTPTEIQWTPESQKSLS